MAGSTRLATGNPWRCVSDSQIVTKVSCLSLARRGRRRPSCSSSSLSRCMHAADVEALRSQLDKSTQQAQALALLKLSGSEAEGVRRKMLDLCEVLAEASDSASWVARVLREGEAGAAATYAPETPRRSVSVTISEGASSSSSPNLLQRGAEDPVSAGGLINRTDGALFESGQHNNNQQQHHQQVDNLPHTPVESSQQKDIEGATESPSGALICVENSRPTERLPATTTFEDHLLAPGKRKEISMVSPVAMPAVIKGPTNFMELEKASAIAPASEDIPTCPQGACEHPPRDGGRASEAGVTTDETVTAVAPCAKAVGSPESGDGAQRIPATNRSDHGLVRALEQQLVAEERDKQMAQITVATLERRVVRAEMALSQAKAQARKESKVSREENEALGRVIDRLEGVLLAQQGCISLRQGTFPASRTHTSTNAREPESTHGSTRSVHF